MNENVNKMSSFIVMDILEKANEMALSGIDDIIHLEVGEPDFDMPKCVVESVQEALNKGLTHYTHSLGDKELRQELAKKYKQEYGVLIDPDCIVLTSGSSPALLMALMVLCESGGEVILSNPGYACYANFVYACGGIPVEVPLSAEDGFQYHIEEIKKVVTEKTRAIFINSPMNPTGTLLSSEMMQELANLNIPILSDEIYHGLVYEGETHSMREFTEDCFVFNGFSKRYAMTGMRLGYLIFPKQYLRQIQTIAQSFFICAPSVSQYAAIAALRKADEEVEEMRKKYNERRVFLIQRLREIGFKIHVEPQGAFYVFADARHLTKDSYRFAIDILEQTHVGVTPGIDFGSRGEGFIRFSYANSIENIAEAMDRIEKYLKEKK
ncbi:MAG: pyridoxal phosphate-dependent aminotransferase [Paludibacteraceae bacterium]|nr:pyridoxal phosphate-dependent aminotransferase [Paludibacteraceae bacterium]